MPALKPLRAAAPLKPGPALALAAGLVVVAVGWASLAPDTGRVAAWLLLVPALALPALALRDEGRTLAALVAAANELAGGNLFVKIPAATRSGPVGDLARAMEALRKTAGEAEATAAEQQADRERAAQRQASLEAFVSRFEATVGTVEQTLTAAAGAMRQTADTLVDQAHRATGQSTLVSQAAGTMSDDAGQLAVSAQEMEGSIDDTRQRMRDVVRVIGESVRAVERTDEAIRELASAAQRIGEIVGLINGIAGQTKMLALNATIEAARAGDMGKGFAVVADEVKKLAGETADATVEITAIIGAIQASVTASVTGTREIAGAVSHVNDTAGAVSAAVDEQAHATRIIADRVRSAVASAGEVSVNIGGVVEATAATREAADEVQGAAGGLTGQSETLRAAVSGFIHDIHHGAIRIGVMHSLSGGSAVSERPLKDLLMMEVADINAAGGLLGRPVEAIAFNTRSSPEATAGRAREALGRDKVSALFGCWSSAGRKLVLPVLREFDGLLFYPSQYEGSEQADEVFYMGAPPNQQIIPALRYLMSPEGGQYRRFYLVGSDTLYPQLTNRVVARVLNEAGVADRDIRQRLLPVGHDDWTAVVADIRAFAAAGRGSLAISTIGGDSNFHFFRDLRDAGLSAREVPVLSATIGDTEIASMDARALGGHMVAWNYLMDVDTPENRDFIQRWRQRSGHARAVVDDAMEASLMGLRLWAQAVRVAGSVEPAAVRRALPGLSTRSLTGFDVRIDPANHHLHRPVLLGRVDPADGHIRVVWKSAGPVAPEPWSGTLDDRPAGLAAG
jgi:urea transport system substrate-binding protein